jgi:hypothetical protein
MRIEIDETNYEAIEYEVLRGLVRLESEIVPWAFLAGLEGLDRDDPDDFENIYSIEKDKVPLDKDGKVIFTTKDVDFDRLKGVHTWKLFKHLSVYLTAPLSERKLKECISYLVSEGYLKYRSDKRYYLTSAGVDQFLEHASKFSGGAEVEGLESETILDGSNLE